MHGASVVFTATIPAVWAAPWSCMLKVLPGLKPYQPNHRAKVPRTIKGTFQKQILPRLQTRSALYGGRHRCY